MTFFLFRYRCCRCQSCTPFPFRICSCGGVFVRLVKRRMAKMPFAA